MKMKLTTIAVMLIYLPLFAYAENQQQSIKNNRHFSNNQLGDIIVTAKPLKSSVDETVITGSEIDKFNLTDISKALNTQAGINIEIIGARNEVGLRMRGYDSRQVPIFLDGIPQYVPYDGYVDYARFLTADLEKIQVSKTGASLLYGANTLGGAINLISRKPQKPFEADIRVGINSVSDKEITVNLGSRQDLFYIQSGFTFEFK